MLKRKKIKKHYLSFFILDDAFFVKEAICNTLYEKPQPEDYQLFLNFVGDATLKAEFVDCLPQIKADIIFLDVELPDGHVWDVIPKIKQHLPNVYLVVMTDGLSKQSQAIRQQYETEVFTILEKPFQPGYLYDIIDRIAANALGINDTPFFLQEKKNENSSPSKKHQRLQALLPSAEESTTNTETDDVAFELDQLTSSSQPLAEVTDTQSEEVFVFFEETLEEDFIRTEDSTNQMVLEETMTNVKVDGFSFELDQPTSSSQPLAEVTDTQSEEVFVFFEETLEEDFIRTEDSTNQMVLEETMTNVKVDGFSFELDQPTSSSQSSTKTKGTQSEEVFTFFEETLEGDFAPHLSEENTRNKDVFEESKNNLLSMEEPIVEFVSKDEGNEVITDTFFFEFDQPSTSPQSSTEPKDHPSEEAFVFFEENSEDNFTQTEEFISHLSEEGIRNEDIFSRSENNSLSTEEIFLTLEDDERITTDTFPSMTEEISQFENSEPKLTETFQEISFEANPSSENEDVFKLEQDEMVETFDLFPTTEVESNPSTTSSDEFVFDWLEEERVEAPSTSNEVEPSFTFELEIKEEETEVEFLLDNLLPSESTPSTTEDSPLLFEFNDHESLTKEEMDCLFDAHLSEPMSLISDEKQKSQPISNTGSTPPTSVDSFFEFDLTLDDEESPNSKKEYKTEGPLYNETTPSFSFENELSLDIDDKVMDSDDKDDDVVITPPKNFYPSGVDRQTQRLNQVRNQHQNQWGSKK